MLNDNWWKADPLIMHERIKAHIDYIEDHQNHHEARNQRHARLYGNSLSAGLGIQDYATPDLRFDKDRIRLNIVKSMCDTITAKIAKTRPKPTFLTNDGDHLAQRKAKDLNKFVEALFLKTKIYQEMPLVFRDSTVFESGFLKIYRDDDEIYCERVAATEIFIDDREAFYGSPGQLHQVKYVPKDKLLQMYPDKEMEIHQASPEYDEMDLSAEMLRVTESWHLPSTKDSNDGVWCISISTGSLEDPQEYEYDYFPFVKLGWSPRLFGYFDQSLTEELVSIQYEINKILQRIQAAFHRLGVPWVFLENGSKIKSEDLRNKIATIIRYNNNPPIVHTAATVHPEVFMHLERLIQRAYEITGISQMSASSRKEPGIYSGIAIREMSDIESERFIIAGQRYEEAFLTASRMYIDLAREIYTEKGSFPVNAVKNGRIQRIDWGEVNLKQDEYEMEIFPTSLLPSTPAGKLQRVQEMINMGMLAKDEALKMLDFPDTKQFQSMAIAEDEYMDHVILETVYGEDEMPPEPLQDLELGIKKMTMAYFRYKQDGADDETLSKMVNWIELAKANLEQASQPPQQMSQELQQAPQQPQLQLPQQGTGQPMPSDMIPGGPGQPPQQGLV